MGQQTDSQGAAGVVESESTWFCETHVGYFWRDLDVYFVTKAEIKYSLTRFNMSNITVDSKNNLRKERGMKIRNWRWWEEAWRWLEKDNFE